MSLVYVDGFETYTSPTQRWFGTNAAFSSISTSTPRTGSRRWQLSNANAFRTLGSANEHATLIIGAACRADAPNGASGLTYMIACSDSAGTIHLTVTSDPSGKLSVRIGNSTGAILGSESGATFAATGVWHYLELKATLSNTVGSAEVRVDGSAIPVISLTNIRTKNDGTKTVFDSVGFGGAGAISVDDLYVCNAAGSINNNFLGDCRVQLLLPTSDGAYQEWTPTPAGTHYTTVKTLPVRTTDYVASATLNARDTWGYDGVPAGVTVNGVQVTTAAAKDEAGARSIAPLVRSGGVDVAGANQALSLDNQALIQLWERNPATSATWTAADVNAAEFGVKVTA